METGDTRVRAAPRSDSLSFARAGGFAAVVYTDILHANYMVLGSVFLMVYGE